MVSAARPGPTLPARRASLGPRANSRVVNPEALAVKLKDKLESLRADAAKAAAAGKNHLVTEIEFEIASQENKLARLGSDTPLPLKISVPALRARIDTLDRRIEKTVELFESSLSFVWTDKASLHAWHAACTEVTKEVTVCQVDLQRVRQHMVRMEGSPMDAVAPLLEGWSAKLDGVFNRVQSLDTKLGSLPRPANTPTPTPTPPLSRGWSLPAIPNNAVALPSVSKTEPNSRVTSPREKPPSGALTAREPAETRPEPSRTDLTPDSLVLDDFDGAVKYIKSQCLKNPSLENEIITASSTVRAEGVQAWPENQYTNTHTPGYARYNPKQFCPKDCDHGSKGPAELNGTPNQRGLQLLAAVVHDDVNSIVRILSECDNDVGRYQNHRGADAVIMATEMNRLACLQTLLERGCPGTQRDGTGMNALHYALTYGYRNAVEALIIAEATELPLKTTKEIPRAKWKYMSEAVKRGDIDMISVMKEGLDFDVLMVDQKTGQTMLHVAATEGMIPAMEYFLDNGIDVNAQDNISLTPLSCAIMRGKDEGARFLVERGAERSTMDAGGRNALHIAAMKGNLACAEFALELGCEVTSKCSQGATPLHYAASEGHWELVRMLLFQRDTEPGDVDNNGNRPVQLAIQRGHTKVVRELIRGGVDLDDLDEHGLTVFHTAVINGKEAQVRMLIEMGSDIDCKDKNGMTALHHAVYHNNLEMIDLLLWLMKKRSDVNAKCGSGRTPLMMAGAKGGLDALRKLLDAGADVNAADASGNTPMHHALKNKDWDSAATDCVHTLLRVEASVNAVNDKGENPLHVACRFSPPEIVKILLDYDADAQLLDKKGLGPLHHAVAKKRIPIVTILLKSHRVGINFKSGEGLTSQDYAHKWGDQDMQRFLQSKGGKIS